MSRGRYPVEYLQNPDINKPLEEIYAELNEYTCEIFEDDPQWHHTIYMHIILPPLWYEGRFVKGIFYNQAIDYTLKLHPRLPELFHSLACPMWCSFPWSTQADAYMMAYHNPHRADWFKNNHGERGAKRLVPMLDTDNINEYFMAPPLAPQKDVDITCVSRLDACKNLPLLAEALAVYRKKHTASTTRMVLVVGKDFDMNHTGLSQDELTEIRKIETILTHPSQYIEFRPRVNYREMPDLYASSKVYVLGSLIEGKNRGIHESMSCNTPVVCFKDYNKFVVGEDMLFPEGAGLMAETFDAECMADTLHTALENYDDFKPRQRYMEHYGRKRFFNRLMDCFGDYYSKIIPDFTPGGRHHENIWLDLAVQANYQLGLVDFIYDRNIKLSYLDTFEEMEEILGFYFERKRCLHHPLMDFLSL